MHLLDLTAIYPNPAVDFEGRSVAAIDRALVAEDARVTTLVLKPWIPLTLARRLPRYRHLAVPSGRLDDGGVDVHFRRYPRIPRLPEGWRFGANAGLVARHVVRHLRRSGLGPFDAVHVQGFPTAPPALMVAEALDLPLALTWRDDPGHLDPEGLHPLERRVLRETVLWLVISPMVERGLRPLLAAVGSRAPIVLAPNAVDVGEIEGLLAGVAEGEVELAGPPGGRWLGVANLYRYKGFHEALAALAKLRARGLDGWHYTIVGDGPYRDELWELATELGLAAQVTFAGRLGHAQTLAMMRAADLFLLPTWREAYGVVFAEAAVCGVPSIACFENGPEMLIDHGETGWLVPPRDVDALAESIAARLDDPEGLRRAGELARQRIGRFTWQRTARIVLEALTDLISNKNLAPLEKRLAPLVDGP